MSAIFSVAGYVHTICKRGAMPSHIESLLIAFYEHVV